MTLSNVGYELLKRLGILGAARTPVLRPQAWVFPGPPNTPSSPPLSPGNGPPTSVNDGIDLNILGESPLVALVGVRLRASPSAHSAYLRVDTADAGRDYGAFFGPEQEEVTVSGVASDKEATVAALKAALDISADFLGLGGAAHLVSTNNNILHYEFPQATAVQLHTGSSDVSPYQSVVNESTFAHWRLWGLPTGTNRWVLVHKLGHQVTREAQDLQPVECAGYSRLYVEVLRSDGAVLPIVGPTTLDGREEAFVEDAESQWATRETELLTFPTNSQGGGFERIVSAEALSTAVTLVPSYTGFDVRGIDDAQVSIVAPQGTSPTFDVEIWTFDGRAWGKAQGGSYSGLTGSWAQLLDVRGSERLWARISALSGGSPLYRSYIPQDPQGGGI